MGDIVFTLPAVNCLRDNFPGSRITFLTWKELAPLLEGFAEVDEVIALDLKLFQSRQPAAIFSNLTALLRTLRSRRFSLAIDLQGYGETALLTLWTRARQRWGNAYRPLRRFAYHRAIARNDQQLHHVDGNISLLRQCGLSCFQVKNEFQVPLSALAEAQAYFALNGLCSAKTTLFIQPLTSSPHKNWPLENYLQLAQHAKAKGVQVLFGGGPADRERLDSVIAAGFPVSAGVGLLTSVGLVQLSTVIVGGNTGLLHLAVAAGKRTVMLIDSKEASKGPGACIPYGHPEWTLTPEEGQSLAEIPAGRLIEAIDEAIGEAKATRYASP